MNQIITFFISFLVFLGISYLALYKSLIKSLGAEFAKLLTTEKLVRIQEGVKKEFTESLEKYKSELNQQLTEKIEPIKFELAKNNIRHQIQFGFLHQERGKVILELYKKLIELHSAMVNWTSFMHPVIEDAEKEASERTKRVNVALNDFRNFYLLNKLFFPEDFCQFIEEIFKDYWSKNWDYGYKQERIRSGELPKGIFKEYYDDIVKISKELKEELPKRNAEIEAILRRVLSVEDEWRK